MIIANDPFYGKKISNLDNYNDQKKPMTEL
jgi:hypothetical protein